MKKPPILLKLVTVFSSVLLVGGFMSYRAGAFNRLIGTKPPAEPGAVFMGSSKHVDSFGYFPPEYGLGVQPVPTSVPQEPAFMGGSKSVRFQVMPPSPNTPGAQPSTSQSSKPSP